MNHFQRMALEFPTVATLAQNFPNLYIDFSESTECVLIGAATYPLIDEPGYKDIDVNFFVTVPQNAVVSAERRAAVLDAAAELMSIALENDDAINLLGRSDWHFQAVQYHLERDHPELKFEVRANEVSVHIMAESPDKIGFDAGYNILIVLPKNKMLDYDVYRNVEAFFNTL